MKKLPRVADLRAEYAKTLAEKREIYKEYRKVKAEMRELLTAKANVDRLLSATGQGQQLGAERQSHDHKITK